MIKFKFQWRGQAAANIVTFEHLAIGEIQSQRIHLGYEYWLSIGGDEGVPLRANFDPATIPTLLPYMILSELHRDPLRVRYRLVGTRICEIDGWDKTGHWMDDEPWKQYEKQWLSDYQTIIDTGRPLFGRDHLTYLDHSQVSLEWSLRPLSTDGKTVDMAFELESFENEAEIIRRPLILRTRPE